MLIGIGDLLLSNLVGEKWEEVRNMIERFLEQTEGEEVAISNRWVVAIPIVELWGMNVHEVPTIVELLEKRLLEPIIYAVGIVRYLTFLKASKPRLLLFAEPIPQDLEALMRGTGGAIPVIYIPFNINEIGRRLTLEEKPAVTIVPVDFVDLEGTVKILEKYFPEGIEIMNIFFRQNPELYNLLHMLGTAYENVEYNPLILLMPYQDLKRGEEIEDIAKSILTTFLVSPVMWAVKGREKYRQATAICGSELLEGFRSGKLIISSGYEHNIPYANIHGNEQIGKILNRMITETLQY